MILLKLLNHPMEDVQTPILRTVGNLLTGDEELTDLVISCEVLPCLTKLFEHPKMRIRRNVMWAISNVTAGNKKQIQDVIDAEIFPKLFIMLSPMYNEAPEVMKEMYYVVTNALIRGNDAQIQYLIDQGVIQRLCGGLLDLDPNVLSALLQALESILKYGESSGTMEQVTKIIEECGGVAQIEALQYPGGQISSAFSYLRY